MDILNQPHDKYFRATFGEVSFATDFLNNYLPKDLLGIVDMDTLEPQKESYLDKQLKEQFTDLLFRVNINNEEGYCKCQSQIVHLLESQNVQFLELVIASFFRFHHIYFAF